MNNRDLGVDIEYAIFCICYDWNALYIEYYIQIYIAYYLLLRYTYERLLN
jgi:hypothetical protein